jgi:hypothetical protein
MPSTSHDVSALELGRELGRELDANRRAGGAVNCVHVLCSVAGAPQQNCHCRRSSVRLMHVVGAERSRDFLQVNR